MATCAVIDADIPEKGEMSNTKKMKDIIVHFGIFFDGTNNNRTQVMMGRLNRAKWKNVSDKDREIIGSMNFDKLKKKEIEKLETSKKKFDFENYVDRKIEILKKRNEEFLHFPMEGMQKVDFTNIAILERFYSPAFQSNENEYAFKIYVTGSGTHADVSKGHDYTGLAVGQGSAGVFQKVLDALDAIRMKTDIIRLNDSIANVYYQFDVFGFSRGATEARMFVDMCTERDNRPDKIKKKIDETNLLLGLDKSFEGKMIFFPKQSNISFNVGIYDTVASVGVIRDSKWANPFAAFGVTMLESISPTVTTYHDENVRDLGLNTLSKTDSVKKVVHICALDEYRENFALCALPEGGVVDQFFMPGCHTDIGGSEMPGYREKVSMPLQYRKKEFSNTEYDCNGAPLIKYSTHRLFIRRVPTLPDKGNNVVEMTFEKMKEIGWIKQDIGKVDLFSEIDEKDDCIDIQRYSFSGYSCLPLQIMAEKTAVFSGTIYMKHMIPKSLPQDFSSMQSAWKGCDSNYGYCYYPETESDYKKLRQDFLHFSASSDLVNGPNFNNNYCYERTLYVERGIDKLAPCE